jgi:homocitrate synthase NifV
LKRVNLSIPISDIQMRAKLNLDRAGVLSRIRDVIAFAVDCGLRVAMGGEDSSRADMDFLHIAVETAESSGAHRFRYADTLGNMEPFSVYEAFRQLCQTTGVELEFHGHDDLGLATANTLAAIRGGATHASEEVAACLNRFHSAGSNVNLVQLPRLAEIVARAARRPIPVGKAIVGANAFTHESGIHVDGLQKDPATYEELSPRTFGRVRQIVLGKHSGLASVAGALQSLGLITDRVRTQSVLDQVRQRSMQAKRVVSSEELMDFYRRATDTSISLHTPLEMKYDCA